MNNKQRNSAVFYKTFYDSIKTLKEKDQIKLYSAIFEYQFYENLIELNGISKTFFMLIKPQLDANNKKYKNGICEKSTQSIDNEDVKISKTEANDKQNGSKRQAKRKLM
jgi:hypothetical protein